MACWYLWPGEPTTPWVALLVAVLLTILTVTVLILRHDARTPDHPRTSRLVEAIDLRIAAQHRESARREQQ